MADRSKTTRRPKTLLVHEAAQEPPMPAPAVEPNTPAPRGKLGTVIAMLRRPDGAGIPDLMEATGWQAHSVRGVMSGAIKKKLGLVVTSEKTETGRIYRIAADLGA